jgi:PKHD-type hydroxylase
MQYMLTPYTKAAVPWAWWEGAFTEAELDWLQLQAKNATTQAEVGGDNNKGEINKTNRRSQVAWLRNTPNTEWVFTKLAHVASQSNAENFGFNLTGFGEPLQLTNYDQAENGMYGWHQDGTSGICRKLSMAIQLTDPEQYTGGDLQVQLLDGLSTSVKRQRGFITIFPSFTLHQVTPVTQGSRQSLVAWVSGPPFK